MIGGERGHLRERKKPPLLKGGGTATPRQRDCKHFFSTNNPSISFADSSLYRGASGGVRSSIYYYIYKTVLKNTAHTGRFCFFIVKFLKLFLFSNSFLSLKSDLLGCELILCKKVGNVSGCSELILYTNAKNGNREVLCNCFCNC